MPERHSIDFVRASVNIIADADKRTIALQYERSHGPPEAMNAILGAISRKFGTGIINRLSQWMTGRSSPFVLPRAAKPHPETPDVLCFEIGVKQSEKMDAALDALIGFLRQQPGYQRTFGPPLDPDQPNPKTRSASKGDASEAADAVMKRMLRRAKNECRAR